MKNEHSARRGRRWAALAALMAAAFAAGALWRGGDPAHRHEPADADPPDAPAEKAQMYYCSMHPQVRSPDPDDKCPICFMDLIPLPVDDDDDDDDEETDLPRLRLSARATALMNIRTWPVERRAMDMEVGLFGKIDFDESRLYNVPARTNAYVERLLVNTPWQPVARGDVLAEFYSPAAVTAMRELLVAGGDATVEAARARLRRMGVTEAQIAEIERTGVAPRTFRVESPTDGVVLAITAREGDFLREGAHLTRIADVSRVWVNLEAYERDLPWLAVGQATHFTVAGLPGKSFEGVVTFTDPVVDHRSRTARLRVEVENPEGLLKPGMYTSAVVLAPYAAPGNAGLQPGTENATLERGDPSTPPHAHTHTPTHDLPLVIPASAPLITGRRALVYVRVPDEERPTFEPRRITLGPRAGDLYIVQEGLSENDLVVVNGQFKIDSELQIRGRPSMMAPEGDGAPAHDHGEHSHAEHAKTDDEQLQTHCPVMGGEINREFYHDHDGHRIYVCCPGCLDEVRERSGEIIEEQRKKGIVFEHVSE